MFKADIKSESFSLKAFIWNQVDQFMKLDEVKLKKYLKCKRDTLNHKWYIVVLSVEIRMSKIKKEQTVS